ncbi:hypothetical protein ACWGTO_08385 [Mesorhizobium sp. PL10]
MVEHFISKSGIGYPDDLTLLKKVYDRIRAERSLDEGCAEAAELAAAAMELFRRGVFEEDALYGELSQV